jgi:hypothetical protein
MTTIAVGIAVAKHVFAVRGVDDTGRAALVRPSAARDKPVELTATLPPDPSSGTGLVFRDRHPIDRASV